MTDKNITKDSMYDAVAPDDFESMLELDRYNNRSTAFDKIISAIARPPSTRSSRPPTTIFGTHLTPNISILMSRLT